MTSVKAPRYTDPFLNALMYPHQAFTRGELYFEGAHVADLAFTSGSVSGDRGSTVRRTLTASFDPRQAPKSIHDTLTPYGAEIKVFRGIRMPNGGEHEYPVFFGRVDYVRFGRTECEVRGSDRAAAVVDGRFEAPRQATRGITVVQQMRNLITEIVPGAVIDVTTPAANLISTPATWDRERGEALDNLAATIAAEWYAAPDGHFKIAPLPALNGQSAGWIVDSGDTGVTITRTTTLDRTAVYNAVVVNGEPPDGTPPAYGIARDDNPASLVRWGGPYGKVPRFFSSQFITTNAQALNTATEMLADAISSTQTVEVSCVVNPNLLVAEAILVSTGAGEFDGMYFISAFTIPLEPENPMTLTCFQALELVELHSTTILRPRTIAVREGIHWPSSG